LPSDCCLPWLSSRSRRVRIDVDLELKVAQRDCLLKDGKIAARVVIVVCQKVLFAVGEGMSTIVVSSVLEMWLRRSDSEQVGMLNGPSSSLSLL
jgi:hypothetical protein